MATGLPAQLRDIQRLLREGRPTEADNQIETIALELDRKAAEEKLKQPAQAEKSLAELQMDFADAVADILGNPPRLTNLLVEIKGKTAKVD
jgi:hypothetical protein